MHPVCTGRSTASPACLYGREERSSAQYHCRAAWAATLCARLTPGCVDRSRVQHPSARLQALTYQHYRVTQRLCWSWTPHQMLPDRHRAEARADQRGGGGECLTSFLLKLCI